MAGKCCRIALFAAPARVPCSSTLCITCASQKGRSARLCASCATNMPLPPPLNCYKPAQSAACRLVVVLVLLHGHHLRCRRCLLPCCLHDRLLCTNCSCCSSLPACCSQLTALAAATCIVFTGRVPRCANALPIGPIVCYCLRAERISQAAAAACRAGTCVGDLANYDLFPIGGPNSVRGFNVGELGSGRSFLEGAAELRLPLPKLSQHIYGFVGGHACFCKGDAGAACLTRRAKWRASCLASRLACLHQEQQLLSWPHRSSCD